MKINTFVVQTYLEMTKLDELKVHLEPGGIYRREQLAQWSKSIDRHLEELVVEGILKKVSQGLYHFPKMSVFGELPPDENELVKGFLKDDRFLITSANAYNTLGVGTTQLYNTRVVYNHKRHGNFKLGNKVFHFQMKPHFPMQENADFLLVDLLNNIDSLAEDKDSILNNVLSKINQLSLEKFNQTVTAYGSVSTKKFLRQRLRNQENTAQGG